MFGIARRALALILLLLASSAWPQTYPDRPLRLVVGFPPGGSGDFLARIIADELTREIGQPVVVDSTSRARRRTAIPCCSVETSPMGSIHGCTRTCPGIRIGISPRSPRLR